MSAWITREWIDESATVAGGKPKRCRAKAEHGTKGVKATDRFAVEWREPGGRRRFKKIRGVGRAAKATADTLCEQINAKLSLGQYAPEASRKHNWKDCRAWYETNVLATRDPATMSVSLQSLAKFEALMHPNVMAEITNGTILEFRAKRKAEKVRGDVHPSDATVNKDLRCVRAFLRCMVKTERMARMPDIPMLREVVDEKAVYTPAEFTAMFQACDLATYNPAWPHGALWWKTLLSLLWETGMRRGEALAVTWAGIDLASNRILLAPRSSKTRVAREFTFGDLTAQQIRLLPRHGLNPLLLPYGFGPGSLNVQLGRIQRLAGIDPKRANLKFHAFRRTVGNTVAEMYGLAAAQQKLGHTTPTITAKHYAAAAMRGLARSSMMPIPEALKIFSA